MPFQVVVDTFITIYRDQTVGDGVRALEDTEASGMERPSYVVVQNRDGTFVGIVPVVVLSRSGAAEPISNLRQVAILRPQVDLYDTEEAHVAAVQAGRGLALATIDGVPAAVLRPLRMGTDGEASGPEDKDRLAARPVAGHCPNCESPLASHTLGLVRDPEGGLWRQWQCAACGQIHTVGGDRDVPTESFPQESAEPPPRTANVDLVEGGTGEHCDATRPLSPETAYRLRIDIGPHRQTSAVENPEIGFPDDVLPESADGHWLDVVVTSDDFAVATERHSLFLPNVGGSWVCGCPQNGPHECADQREPYLFVPVTSPAEVGLATLRLGFYYGNNLLQSQLLTAWIGVADRGEGRGYGSVIDYSLTRTLTNVGRLPPRTLNIMTNDNGDGSHRFVLVNGKQVLHDTLDAQTVKDAIENARTELHNTHRRLLSEAVIRTLGDGTEYLVQPAEYEDLLKTLNGITNAKQKDDFVADLRRVANLGWVLYQTLFKRHPRSRRELQEMLKEQAIIQACSVKDGGSPLLFPWALIYDIYLDSDPSVHQLCPVLDDWQPGRPLAEPGVTRCPHDDGENHQMDLICPFGFWGFKHVIEQPPSLPEGRDLPLRIMLADEKANMAVGLSLDLDSPEDHVRALRETLAQKVRMVDGDSKNEILDMLGDTGLDLVYLFCHGRRLKLSAGAQSIPFLEVGRSERLTTGDIMKWQDRLWPEEHWEGKWPLVFINGCHTAELTPDAMVSFVDAFMSANAGGVIGTEVTVSQALASEAALLFFSSVLREGGSVGQAIRAMRLDFLFRGNVMGLAYTPYCSASLHLG